MSEYKENTVGWFLDTLKEPLRSRAIDNGNLSLNEHCLSILEAIEYIHEMGQYPDEDADFWKGVLQAAKLGFARPEFSHAMLNVEGWKGFDMAKECAPDPVEEPAPELFCVDTKQIKDVLGIRQKVKAKLDDLRKKGILHPGALKMACTNEEFGESTPLGSFTFYCPAVEGYTPPRCVTESEHLAQALKRIEALEARVEKLVNSLNSTTLGEGNNWVKP